MSPQALKIKTNCWAVDNKTHLFEVKELSAFEKRKLDMIVLCYSSFAYSLGTQDWGVLERYAIKYCMKNWITVQISSLARFHKRSGTS